MEHDHVHIRSRVTEKNSEIPSENEVTLVEPVSENEISPQENSLDNKSEDKNQSATQENNVTVDYELDLVELLKTFYRNKWLGEEL